MLLIIQNGYMETSIQRYLSEEYQIVKSYDVDVSSLDLEPFSVVILLGGNQSVTKIEDYPCLVKVIKLINKCLEIKKPILGICLGCQLIAYALGCEVLSSNKLNVGYDIKVFNEEELFRCHVDYIIPNDKLIVLETYEEMPYLYKHLDHVYGIQCHPDLSPESVKLHSNCVFCNNYAKNNYHAINSKNRSVINQLLKDLKQ